MAGTPTTRLKRCNRRMADLKSTSSEIRRTRANAVRALSMDAVQQAKSGHPGMPMGMA
ncbi:MAG: hypothetical protein VX234_02305, partial [Pseudomonadota bacterium]|nr:hypothetical protein [Pseudomonadota bacterium]